MKLRKAIYLTAFLAAVSCTVEPQDPTPDPIPQEMTVSASEIVAAQQGETLSLSITSPTRPKLTGIPEWITFHDGVFKNYSITFTLDVQTNTAYESRDAVITVSAEGLSSQSVTVSQAGAVPPPEPGVDPQGWENAAAAARNMGTGWNLGNTLDSNSGDVNHMWIEAWSGRTTKDYETAWGQPVTTRELIHMFKEAGFGAIRVPVTWYPHIGTITLSGANWDMSSWTGFEVDPVWMARVKEVVGYVLDEGLYCILNVHHDTGDASTAWLRADPAVYDSTKERYCALWTQIATEFESCGEKLLFESFNEMLDSKGTWNYSTSANHEVINLYNSDFVEVVRATGGNNMHRNLILNTYSSCPLPQGLGDFRLPQDEAKGHLLAEVHSYSPYRFAADVSNPITVFDSACENEVKGIIQTINQYLVSKGIPCVIGEYGCTASRTEQERAKQAACYVSNAAEYNIPCFYWMSMSDGADRAVPKWTTPALKDAILKAYQDNKR